MFNHWFNFRHLFNVPAFVLAGTFHCFAGNYLSEGCIDELIELPNAKEDFDMITFLGDLVTSVGKVKSCEFPIVGVIFCPGDDDKIIDIGLSVGCLKELSKNPERMTEIVKSDIAPNVIKAMAAEKLGIKRKDIPADINKLKNVVKKQAHKKAAEFLEMEPNEVPTNLKDLEDFMYNKIKEQSKQSLAGENLKRAEDVLNIVRLVNGLDALTDMIGGEGEPIKISLNTAKKNEDKFFEIGLRAGANASMMQGNKANVRYNYKLGYHGGVVFDIGYFQTGLMLFQKGAVVETDIQMIDSDSAVVSQEIVRYYAEVPLLLSGKIAVGNFHLVLDAGAYIARGLKQSVKNVSENASAGESLESNDENGSGGRVAFSENDYGLKLGVGAKFGGGFYAGVFGNYGLAQNEETKLHTIGVNVGYGF